MIFHVRLAFGLGVSSLCSSLCVFCVNSILAGCRWAIWCSFPKKKINDRISIRQSSQRFLSRHIFHKTTECVRDTKRPTENQTLLNCRLEIGAKNEKNKQTLFRYPHIICFYVLLSRSDNQIKMRFRSR